MSKIQTLGALELDEYFEQEEYFDESHSPREWAQFLSWLFHKLRCH
jgi:hypothetical protein